MNDQDPRIEAAASALEALHDAGHGIMLTPTPQSLSTRELGADLNTRLTAIAADSVARAADGDQVAARDSAMRTFFEMQPEYDQGALLAHLAVQEQKPISELARIFGINAGRAMRAIQQAIDQIGAEMLGIKLEAVVGQLTVDAQRAIDGLAADGEWKDMWTVRKEFTQKLEDFDIVRSAPKRVEVKHTHGVDSAQKDEIEKMLELERKKQRRGEEIKQAEARVVDELPEVRE